MIATPSQMQDLLAELLEGAVGNTRDHWRHAIGEVQQLLPLLGGKQNGGA